MDKSNIKYESQSYFMYPFFLKILKSIQLLKNNHSLSIYPSLLGIEPNGAGSF